MFLIVNYLIVFTDDMNPIAKRPTCDLPCYKYNSCENCTSKNCMWCGSQQRCVETNSYVASFLYGQCKEWTTTQNKCAGRFLENVGMVAYHYSALQGLRGMNAFSGYTTL